MIRINLLSEGRRPVVARRTKPKLALGDQDPSLYILIAGVVVGVLIAAGWIYSLNSELSEVEGKVKRAKKEVKELKPILEEVEAFKRKKEELDNKITLITDLNEKRRGPVFVMDQVSRALPDLVWLRSMNVKGKRVSLSGTAFNTNAVAAFIENLVQVPEFREPNTKNVQRSNRGKTYSFRISFRYENPKPPPEPTVEAAEAEAELGDEVDQPAA